MKQCYLNNLQVKSIFAFKYGGLKYIVFSRDKSYIYYKVLGSNKKYKTSLINNSLIYCY